MSHISEKLFVCHKCDNPGCINPSHLFLGTGYDNIQDMVSKGRQARGAMISTARLTEEVVLNIRDKFKQGSTIRGLAREYGVGKTTISHIVKRETWKHI
jgi:hypothetical protein